VRSKVQLSIKNRENVTNFTQLLCSLVKYHVTTLQVLAATAVGKNAESQTKLVGLVPVDKAVKNIIDMDRNREGVLDDRVNADTVHYVRGAWITFLVEVHFNCRLNDTVTMQQIQSSSRIFGNRDGQSVSLMELFAHSLAQFKERLESLPNIEDYVEHPERLEGLADDRGDDLGAHFFEVQEITRAALSFFSKWEDGNLMAMADAHASAREQVKLLHDNSIALYKALSPFYYDKVSRSLVELVSKMKQQGIEKDGITLALQMDARVVEKPTPSKERYFQEGWQKFREYISYYFEVRSKLGDRFVASTAI
jgi:hypothetical protein